MRTSLSSSALIALCNMTLAATAGVCGSASMPPLSTRSQPPTVRSRPFVAKFRCYDSASANLLSHGTMYRDSRGRARSDYTLSEGDEVRIIDDVVQLTLMVFDVKRHLFHKERCEAPRSAWSFSRVEAIYVDERMRIHGTECRRVLFKPFSGRGVGGGDVGGAWIAETEGLVLAEDNPAEGWRWELTNLEFLEPEPIVFSVPAGFTAIEER